MPECKNCNKKVESEDDLSIAEMCKECDDEYDECVSCGEIVSNGELEDEECDACRAESEDLN